MYEIEIKTKYNEFKVYVDDLEDEQVKEILSQPYIIEAKPKIYTGNPKKVKVLKRCKNT